MSVYSTALRRASWPLLLGFVALAAAAGALLPKLSIEAGTDVLLDQSDPDLAYYNQSRVDWNTTDEYVLFALTRDDWFTPEGVALLNEFVAEVRTLPHVREITALNNTPLLRITPGLFPTLTSLDAADFLADKQGRPLPEDQKRQRLAKAEDELRRHNIARDNLISADGRSTFVLAYLDIPADLERTDPRRTLLRSQPPTAETERELAELEPVYRASILENNRRREALVHASRALSERWRPRLGEPIRRSGIPIININIVEHIADDVKTFGIVSVLFFMLTYLVIYRRPIRWMLLPVVACTMPPVIVIGLLVATDHRMTVITSNLPLLMFVLTLPYSVYLIERYRELRAQRPEDEAAETAAAAGQGIWIPCLYSATTTMAGLASLATSGIIPVRTFGIFGSIGMAFALGATFLFLAPTFRLLPAIPVKARAGETHVISPLRPLVSLVLRAPLVVLALGAALLGVSVWGSTKITAETKFIDYFWPKSEVYQGLLFIDQRSGTTPLEIILEGPEPGYFKTAKGLKDVDQVAAFFAQVPETGNVRTISLLVDEVRKFDPRRMKEKGSLDLLSRFAPKMVREFCNDDFSTTRVLVRMKETAPTLNRKAILDALGAHLAKPEFAHLKEKRATGVFVLYSNMLQSLLKSQRDTFLIVIGVILLMLKLLFRNPLIAILVLVPQVLPVFVVLGVMGFAGIPLDMVTTMIASVAMGVGIDAAIQYAVRYRIELDATGDRALAVQRSHATIGRAILIAVSIMFAGFLVLVASKFVPTVYFGIFTGLAMLMGLLASLTILPASFVALRYPRPRAKPPA